MILLTLYLNHFVPGSVLCLFWELPVHRELVEIKYVLSQPISLRISNEVNWELLRCLVKTSVSSQVLGAECCWTVGNGCPP